MSAVVIFGSSRKAIGVATLDVQIQPGVNECVEKPLWRNVSWELIRPS